MTAARSPPLFFATASLPAPAGRPDGGTRTRTSITRSPVLTFPPPPPPAAASVTNTAARTSRRATIAASSHDYVYPDPIPAFSQSETKKFKTELRRKLCEEIDTFGDDVDAVLDVCSKIFSEFLHDEYGGPGTLQVEPFTDMMVALKDENLPGAASATRVALLWAQNYVDRDWESWNATNSPN